MNSLKERLVTTKAITTLLTSVLVASFAGTMLSMPQMIQSVNAQSEQGEAAQRQ
jgi:Sec-independent protein secretion pathway component TatC